MRTLPVGEDALLVEVASGEEAQALLAELLRRRAEGSLTAREIVPAARTVLLDGLPDPARLAAELTSRPVPPAPPRPAETVEIPVRYDGPDLADVAAHWGVSVPEVARIHAATEFRVAFCGFAPVSATSPAFPPATRCPAGRRRARPSRRARSRWRARTRASTRAPPRRLAADRHDRPRPVGPHAGARGAALARHARAFRPRGRDGAGDMTDRALSVVRAGALTTVQDRGRPGHAHLGVPHSGALDGPAAALANRLAGNRPDAAVLESTLDGCSLRPRSSATVAVTGAPCRVTVDGRPAAWGAPGAGARGGRPGRRARGPRGAVVRGRVRGIAVDPVLGSRSTDLLSGLGPTPLTDGAVLPLGTPTGLHARVDVAPQPAPPAELVLRVTPGPRDDWFTAGALRRFTSGTFRVSPASNRIGLRTTGPVLERVRHEELPSEGMVLGAVQVPPAGTPVIFLADHPTTGGYPVIAVVRPADLPAAAQARPGTPVRFVVARGRGGF